MDKFLNDLEKFVSKMKEMKLHCDANLIAEFIRNYNWSKEEYISVQGTPVSAIEPKEQRKHELYRILSEEIDHKFKKELQKDTLEILYKNLNERVKKYEMTPENFQTNLYDLTVLKERIEKVENWSDDGWASVEMMIRIYNKTKTSLGM